MKYKGIIKKACEANSFIEEGEFVKEYFRTERLQFGVSELLPGKIGGLDKGHSEADEVFYCAAGHVLCYFPEEDKYYELEKGDALLIPQGMSHKIFNIEDSKAIIIWCCAPHP